MDMFYVLPLSATKDIVIDTKAKYPLKIHDWEKRKEIELSAQETTKFIELLSGVQTEFLQEIAGRQ